jgi:hypothetical protein
MSDIGDAINRVLAQALEPMTVTDLRFHVQAKLPCTDPEEIRERVFAMIQSGYLRLSAFRHVYRA